MKSIGVRLLFALVAVSTLLIPVRLGLAGDFLQSAGVHAQVVGDMTPCHGSADAKDTNSDSCTEHCWRTAVGSRAVVSVGVERGPEVDSDCRSWAPSSYIYKGGGESLDLDYIGRLVRKRQVLTVVLRN